MADTDPVFRALADPTRRHLLDRLRRRNGQTLGELSADLGMARQSASQHLAVLESANLISTVRRGREKVHYLNPTPIHEIQERWIATFERPRLQALSAVKRRAEEHTMNQATDVPTGTTDASPTYVYVTYIEATPERVWHALTDADLTAAYWGHSNVSTWEVGAPWEHRRTDGSEIADVAGSLLECDPPRRLVLTFGPADDDARRSRVSFTIEPHEQIVRLTVTHEDLPSRADRDAAAAGWPAVLANLKSLLETGHVLPQAPWEMHAELRDAQLARQDPR